MTFLNARSAPFSVSSACALRAASMKRLDCSGSSCLGFSGFIVSTRVSVLQAQPSYSTTVSGHFRHADIMRSRHHAKPCEILVQLVIAPARKREKRHQCPCEIVALLHRRYGLLRTNRFI